MLKKKPSWVPDWVWAEYVAAYSGPSARRMSSETADSLIADSDCANVWRALGRRASLFEKHQIEVEAWHKDRGRDLPRRAGQFSSLITAILTSQHIPKSEAISASERKEISKRICRLTNKLESELKIARLVGVWPSGIGLFGRIIQRDIHEYCNENLIHASESDVRKLPYLQRKDVLKYAVDSSCAFVLDGTGRSRALEAIEKAALALAETSPLLYREKIAGAKRKYFVIQMTKYFQRIYGEKLLDVTTTLVRIILGTDIEKSAVTQLNTVRVRRKRKN